MQGSIRGISQSFKLRIKYYRRLLQHQSTPWLSRALLWLALAYALSPIDIIPDFVPVLGYLDDVVIVPGLALVAIWMIPEEVIRDCEDPESSLTP